MLKRSINSKVENNKDGTKKYTNIIIIEGVDKVAEDLIGGVRYISDFETKLYECIHTKPGQDKFQFKIKIYGESRNCLEIYYLSVSPAPELLKYSLKIRNILFAQKEYSMVQPDKWQLMEEMNYQSLKNKFIYKSGELHLNLEITIKKEIKLLSCSSLVPPKAELNSDLDTLLNISIYSDVTIKSVEGAEFKTRKVILAARSDVLKAHFEHNMLENQTNIINTSLDTYVLQEVIRYIYTDNTPQINVKPEKLLAAADYYQLNRLKQLCEEALFKKLTFENAIDTLEIAVLHSANNLKKVTLEFICNGSGGLIEKTKAWIKLQPAAIDKTILDYILDLI